VKRFRFSYVFLFEEFIQGSMETFMIEMLEQRRLLAAVTNGVLTLGTDIADVYVISVEGQDLVVMENGQRQVFALSEVSFINADLRDGDDYFNMGGVPIPAFIFGGAGSNTIIGGSSRDTIYGGSGDDEIRGGPGNDSIQGGAGNDTIRAGLGNDVVAGGSGNDEIYGGEGHDLLRGNEGDDTIRGLAGNDSIYGGKGNDLLSGGSGDDILDGLAGIDTVNGQLGMDICIGEVVNDPDNFVQGSSYLASINPVLA